ncbi:hypothetical protein LW135_03515 [Helicobacter sp. faydin-H20]|uniref:hypothetical protein n=1 Tax=Helicobacter anatolicus TaxID=2905874 RepID=UPI001E41E869|nr:hypothetical protein [Helicobacter anatolicus]MCE3036899.1 hypothetical protein [Helicobacter anatolicus]
MKLLKNIFCIACIVFVCNAQEAGGQTTQKEGLQVEHVENTILAAQAEQTEEEIELPTQEEQNQESTQNLMQENTNLEQNTGIAEIPQNTEQMQENIQDQGQVIQPQETQAPQENPQNPQNPQEAQEAQELQANPQDFHQEAGQEHLQDIEQYQENLQMYENNEQNPQFLQNQDLQNPNMQEEQNQESTQNLMQENTNLEQNTGIAEIPQNTEQMQENIQDQGQVIQPQETQAPQENPQNPQEIQDLQANPQDMQDSQNPTTKEDSQKVYQFTKEDEMSVPQVNLEEQDNRQELFMQKMRQVEDHYKEDSDGILDFLNTTQTGFSIQGSFLERDSRRAIVDKINELKGIEVKEEKQEPKKVEKQEQEVEDKKAKKTTKKEKNTKEKNKKEENKKTQKNEKTQKEEGKAKKDVKKQKQTENLQNRNLLEEKRSKQVILSQEEVYELDETDFSLVQQKGGYAIKVLSAELENFMYGQGYNTPNQVQTFSVNNNHTQIINKNGKIKEYRYYQKKSKKNFLGNQLKYPLEKMGLDLYKIIIRTPPPLFDISECRITRTKQLNANLITNQEVIMDLDLKREMRNMQDYRLFLECPR